MLVYNGLTPRGRVRMAKATLLATVMLLLCSYLAQSAVFGDALPPKGSDYRKVILNAFKLDRFAGGINVLDDVKDKKKLSVNYDINNHIKNSKEWNLPGLFSKPYCSNQNDKVTPVNRSFLLHPLGVSKTCNLIYGDGWVDSKIDPKNKNSKNLVVILPTAGDLAYYNVDSEIVDMAIFSILTSLDNSGSSPYINNVILIPKEDIVDIEKTGGSFNGFSRDKYTVYDPKSYCHSMAYSTSGMHANKVNTYKYLNPGLSDPPKTPDYVIPSFFVHLDNIFGKVIPDGSLSNAENIVVNFNFPSDFENLHETVKELIVLKPEIGFKITSNKGTSKLIRSAVISETFKTLFGSNYKFLNINYVDVKSPKIKNYFDLSALVDKIIANYGCPDVLSAGGSLKNNASSTLVGPAKVAKIDTLISEKCKLRSNRFSGAKDLDIKDTHCTNLVDAIKSRIDTSKSSNSDPDNYSFNIVINNDPNSLFHHNNVGRLLGYIAKSIVNSNDVVFGFASSAEADSSIRTYRNKYSKCPNFFGAINKKGTIITNNNSLYTLACDHDEHGNIECSGYNGNTGVYKTNLRLPNGLYWWSAHIKNSEEGARNNMWWPMSKSISDNHKYNVSESIFKDIELYVEISPMNITKYNFSGVTIEYSAKKRCNTNENNDPGSINDMLCVHSAPNPYGEGYLISSVKQQTPENCDDVMPFGFINPIASQIEAANNYLQ